MISLLDIHKAVTADWINSPEHVTNWLVDSEQDPVETYPSNQAFTSVEIVRKMMALIREDGSWLEVNYRDERREAWPAIHHFTTYLHPMVVAYAVGGAPLYHDPELKAAILSAIQYWLENDWINPNWWYGAIGLPAYYLGPVLLVMREELNPAQRKKAAAILDRCDLKERAEWRSGGNALYDCRAAIFSGLFSNDAALIARVFKEELCKWLRVTPAEGSGVKEDYSHWEHGNLLYNHGYGLLVLVEGGRWMSHTRAVNMEPDREALEFLTRYLLEGSQWMERRGFLDPAAAGRKVATPLEPALGIPGYLSHAARYLIRAGAPRQDELQAIINRALGIAPPLTGNRVFPFSDFMTHSRPEFYASVRMASDRTLNTEICNGVNRLGYHLGMGSMYLVRRGNEYENLFPVWDWNKVPGVTAALADLADHGIDEIADSGWFPQINPKQEGFGRARLRVSRFGRSPFAGGVSDGRYGVAALDQKVLSREGRKSWFFFDDGYVCLGAGINAREPSPLFTTVNQCCLVGKVNTVDCSGVERALHTGTYSLPGVRGVNHDGVSYLFPGNQQVVCSNQFQTGDWHQINVNQANTRIEEEVFCLWIEHGAMPHDGSYCYQVFPGMDLPASMEVQAGIEILINTRNLQAVRDKVAGVSGMVFFTEGIMELAGSRRVIVSAPCLLILVERENRLYIADPARRHGRISIELDGRMYFADLAFGRTTVIEL